MFILGVLKVVLGEGRGLHLFTNNNRFIQMFLFPNLLYFENKPFDKIDVYLVTYFT